MIDYKIGELAAKYETPGKNLSAGYISNGNSWGDPGGISYGSYQLESKEGTLQEYLHLNDEYTVILRAFTINSPSFKEKWKALGESDPLGFKQSQFNYVYNKYNGAKTAINYAESLGWDIACFALQSAIFSTANQSGGWRHILNNANDNHSHNTTEEQINALYDARKEYFDTLNISSEIKRNIINERTINERKDCLALLNTY